MNYKKIRLIEDRIRKNRKKITEEKENRRRDILRLKIGIDEYRVKLEKLLKQNIENIGLGYVEQLNKL